MNEDGIFYEVENMPTFKQGDPSASFKDYIYRNIQHPAYADAIDYEGVVGIEFTMDSKGMVRDPVVTRSSFPDLNMEAMRVLIGSPAWEPGMQRNIPVNVRLSCEVEFVDENSPERYYMVENMPLFNNQDPAESFRIFIAENLRYPERAAEADISGRVIVQFTVMPDGSINEIMVVRGVHPLLDQEAMRIVSTSPDWTPGKQRGQNVSVVFTYPINFIIGL